MRLARAVHIVAELRAVQVDVAREELREAAERAGVSEDEIVRGVLLFHTDE